MNCPSGCTGYCRASHASECPHGYTAPPESPTWAIIGGVAFIAVATATGLAMVSIWGALSPWLR